MRLSFRFLIFTAVNMGIFMLLPLHARQAQLHSEGESKRWQSLAKSMRVTDLCLATEARYTRHPAVSDRHAPFQEHPLALEHFPSGSLILPPKHRDY